MEFLNWLDNCVWVERIAMVVTFIALIALVLNLLGFKFKQ